MTSVPHDQSPPASRARAREETWRAPGSVDATVIVRAQQLVLEPGDTVTVQDGTVVVIDHG